LSAPGMIPAPCQTSGVSPARMSHTVGSKVVPRAEFEAGDAAGVNAVPAAGNEAPRTRASSSPRTDRAKVDTATPPKQQQFWQRKRHLPNMYPDSWRPNPALLGDPKIGRAL